MKEKPVEQIVDGWGVTWECDDAWSGKMDGFTTSINGNRWMPMIYRTRRAAREAARERKQLTHLPARAVRIRAVFTEVE